jgi:hypothetical protein
MKDIVVHLEDQETDGRIILRCFLEKYFHAGMHTVLIYATNIII